MSIETESFIKKYRFSREIRKYSVERNNTPLHARINNKEDIIRYYNSANTVYEQLRKNFDLVDEDIIMFKEAIADYEVCVNKVIQMMDTPISNTDWNYSIEELNKFISQLKDLYIKINSISQRKLFQD